MKDGLEYQKKSNDLKTKENDELRNEIEKLKKAKVQKSNIIDNLTKSSTPSEILQNVRKRDDKVRTFALPDNDDEMKKLAQLTKARII